MEREFPSIRRKAIARFLRHLPIAGDDNEELITDISGIIGVGEPHDFYSSVDFCERLADLIESGK